MGSSSISLEVLQLMLTMPSIKVSTVWTNPPKPMGRGQQIQETPVASFIKHSPQHSVLLREPQRIDKQEIDFLKNHPLDFIMVAAYGHILPTEWITLPRLGCFNIHFSLLPRYRGASPIQAAILNGDSTTGITIQKINEKLDAGDIVSTRSFPLTGLSAPQAFEESLKAVKLVLPKFCRQLIDGNLKFTPQNHDLSGEYCRKIKKNDGQIKSPMSIPDIFRKYLAYQPWPGVFFLAQGEKYNLIDIQQISKQETQKIISEFKPHHSSSDIRDIQQNIKEGLFLFKLNSPARLLLAHTSSQGVTDGWDLLNISSLQKSGKNPLPVKEFLNGIKWEFPIAL